jgi:uncharacterized protein (DUF305 family)
MANRLHSEVEPFVKKEHAPSRRLGETPVLLALAAIVWGVLSLGLLFVPQLPGDDSPEAGFARDMINHHAQAVQMADTVRQRTESEEIRVLATDIVLTQQAEVGQMQGWLAAWGLPTSATRPAMAWMGHPTTGSMPGMAKPEDLARLHQASPEEADEQFLRLMIPHHRAAIPMAEAVLERSDRPEVRRLAQRVVTSQEAEIRGMQALLERKGSSPVEDLEPSLDPDEHLSDEHLSDEHLSDEHGHLAADALWETVRLAPLPLAVLAAAWLGIDALRRRYWVGLAEYVTPPPVWTAVAVGGLIASAALNMGLAPAHFEEAAIHGGFFFAASASAAIAAAAILAWPSRLAYLAGAALSLALIVLWAVFLVVSPAGVETVEDVDLVGLLTTVTELVAMSACVALWLRARRAYRSEQGSLNEPLHGDGGRV